MMSSGFEALSKDLFPEKKMYSSVIHWNPVNTVTGMDVLNNTVTGMDVLNNTVTGMGLNFITDISQLYL